MATPKPLLNGKRVATCTGPGKPALVGMCDQCLAVLAELRIPDEWDSNDEVQLQLELHLEAMALFDDHGGDDGISGQRDS